jgi:hypothetical protein
MLYGNINVKYASGNSPSAVLVAYAQVNARRKLIKNPITNTVIPTKPKRALIPITTVRVVGFATGLPARHMRLALPAHPESTVSIA